MKLKFGETEKFTWLNWKTGAAVLLVLAAAVFFFATRPEKPEKIKREIPLALAKLETAKGNKDFVQVVAFPGQVSATLSKKDQISLIKNTYLQAVLSPTPLKVGKKTELSYRLYSRYSTNYDGPVAAAKFGSVKADFIPLKEFATEKVSVLKKEITKAVVAKVALTPAKAGEQDLNFGAFKITIVDRKSGKGMAAIIVFPTVKVTVAEK